MILQKYLHSGASKIQRHTHSIFCVNTWLQQKSLSLFECIKQFTDKPALTASTKIHTVVCLNPCTLDSYLDTLWDSSSNLFCINWLFFMTDTALMLMSQISNWKYLKLLQSSLSQLNISVSFEWPQPEWRSDTKQFVLYKAQAWLCYFHNHIWL